MKRLITVKEIFLSCSSQTNKYCMIPRITFVWFFSISSTSYVIPIVLYNTKTVSHSSMHVKSENQNTKRRMETKNIPYFCFWINWCWRANSMKKTSCISNDSNNLSKPGFGCYFCSRIVNFRNLIFFGTYGLCMVCK